VGSWYENCVMHRDDETITLKNPSILEIEVMSISRYLFNRITRVLSLVTVVGLMAGCGVDHSPMASIDESLTVPEPAAKKGGKGKDKKASTKIKTANEKTHDGSTSVEEDFGDNGGKITVQIDADMELLLGDLKVTLDVPKNALRKGETIEMNIYAVHPNYPDGDNILPIEALKASNMVIDFGPDGLEFRKSCELIIKLGPELNDLGDEGLELNPWHQHGNGKISQAGIISYFVTDTGGLEVRISVDGFSRYGLRD